MRAYLSKWIKSPLSPSWSPKIPKMAERLTGKSGKSSFDHATQPVPKD